MNRASPKLMSDKIGITEFKASNGKVVLKLFDSETGEIFEDSEYTVRPFKQVDPLPRFSREEQEALDYRSSIDKKYSRSTDKYFGDIQTIEKSHGNDILKQLLTLTKYVKVHNVLFLDRIILCEMFSCTNANLNRKLNSLVKRNLIKYETKGLMKPKSVKILIHPFVFWFGSFTSRMHEWLSYWCPKSEAVLEFEANTLSSGEDESLICVDSYDITYDIGVYDDSREYIGDSKYLMKESNIDYLTEANLIYLIYGV